MSYHAPLDEITRTARLVGQDRLAATERFAEATDETRNAILTEAAKLAEQTVAPVNRAGDLHPARLENGVVRCSPGYREAYEAIASGGWVGMTADPEHGGMGLPQSFAVMVREMLASGCLSLSLCPVLSEGQIEALEVHGSEELKALYLPKLTSGEWTGTMNLTEPQAGSDVGALSSKAEPRGDGTYAVTGQKIYISWGDHDIAENVVHLVLARLPGAPAGTRGLSLFLVPKRIPDAEGRAGVANAVRTVSLEHKMGLHGSPTAVMAFEGATGWLVGEEGAGIACMFTMMNNARLSVGIEGVGIAETALQAATAWARDRRQGRTADGTDTIIGHADVRRMLMSMMAQTRIARALCYDCALALDMGRAAEDAAGRAAEAARGAFLTPIAKAFGTYTGMEVADLAIQVHGGMGYIEEAGVAQLARDVRVTAIYEGTNGIQAMDLVGRKLAGDGGAAAQGVLADVTATVEAARAAGETVLADRLDAARVKLEGVTSWMLESEANDRAAGAAPYLRMWALVLGGHYLLRSALSGGSVERALAGFFVSQVLPQAHALAQAAVDGAEALYAIEAEAFGA